VPVGGAAPADTEIDKTDACRVAGPAVNRLFVRCMEREAGRAAAAVQRQEGQCCDAACSYC
jgi:hypothetical protein